MFKVRYVKDTGQLGDERFCYKCPHCGKLQFFFLVSPKQCMSCFKQVPDVKKMLYNSEYRIEHYFGKEDEY